MLRVFEEGAFRRVGGLKDIPLNVRVIAASNRDLKTESEAGRFRLDLFYRLSVIQIDMPPLRERGDDVILLAQHYVASFSERLRIRIHGLLPEVANAFRSYEWPGNVELRNVIERALILEDGEMVRFSTCRAIFWRPMHKRPAWTRPSGALGPPTSSIICHRKASRWTTWKLRLYGRR